MIKEVRQFFVRHEAVNSGAYRDREITFKKTYSQGVLKGKYNTFLKDDYPSQNIYQKLITSVPFILNPESTAFEKQAGIVVKATDAKALNRDSSDNGIYESDGTTTGTAGISQDTIVQNGLEHTLNSNNFTSVVLPHQLPNIVVNSDEDGTDSIISSVTKNGITLTRLSTLISNLGGKLRKNFKIAVEVFRSITIDTSTQKVQLVNDLDSVTNGYYGALNSTRGWQQLSAAPIADGAHAFTAAGVTLTITTSKGLITAITTT